MAEQHLDIPNDIPTTTDEMNYTTMLSKSSDHLYTLLTR